MFLNALADGTREAKSGGQLMRRSVLRLVSLVCLSVSGGFGCAAAGKSPRDKNGGGTAAGGVWVGERVPKIVVKTLDGARTIDLGSMQGTVVLLDIWASWCGPCREEMPLLDAIAGRVEDEGIEVIAVSIDEKAESAEEFLSGQKNWKLTVAHDPKGTVAELLKPPKMPTSYLIDGEGVVRYVNAGFDRGDVKKMEKRLLRLAKEGS